MTTVGGGNSLPCDSPPIVSLRKTNGINENEARDVFQPSAVDQRRNGLLRPDSDYANGCAIIALCPLMCGRDWCLAFGTSAY